MKRRGDTVEFSRKKCISCLQNDYYLKSEDVWMFNDSKEVLVNLMCVVNSVTFYWNKRMSECNPLFAVVKNVLWN